MIAKQGIGTDKALSIVSGPSLRDNPVPGGLTLPAFFGETAERFAEREALVLRTRLGVERWSYAVLWARAYEVARALLACGIGKGNRVGILMTNRPEWLSGFFGASLCGAIVVPLSTFSTPAELEYQLQTAGISVLLFERSVVKKDFLEILCELEPRIRADEAGALRSTKFPFLRHLAVVGEVPGDGAVERWSNLLARGEAIPTGMVEATAGSVSASDPAALFFSSGSTSSPKGVLNAHRGVVLQFWRQAWMLGLKEDVRAWTANGLFWSGNCAMVLGSTLAVGGTLVLQRIFDPAEALELMASERVAIPHAWPHQWAMMEAAPNWAAVDLSSLHYVDANKPIARHPTVSTNWVEPRWCYGSTETFTISTAFPACTSDEVAGDSHGRPLPGNTLAIVDPLTGVVLPRGERGEIAVKGPTLMLGYIGVPLDETLDAEGFFHTGDGGYIDDLGRLMWEGRLSDIIKTGGANVSPLEIDEALVTHPNIKLSQTVGVPHDTLGEVVVGCIVLHGGCVIDEADVRKFLQERLASYKVPRRVLFLREEDITTTGSSKVKTNDLRELAVRIMRARSDPLLSSATL